MSNYVLASVFVLLLIQLSMIDCRPHTQKIVVHGHEWTVPNESGWEEVLHEAEPIRHRFLTNCGSSRECRLAAERLREIFLKYPVSAKYYDDSLSSDHLPSEMDSVFKWG
ncbi:hypothetical protein I4U23_025886 [Adineta vaga]|nr:hypothetical protein I4U23_025886 [Adineta vaga]